MSRHKNKDAVGKVTGSNPVGSTSNFSETLVSRINRLRGTPEQNVLCVPQTGVFCTGFDAKAYERYSTILNERIRLVYGAPPDIKIVTPFSDSKQESTPVSMPKKQELRSIGTTGRMAHEQA